MSTKANDATLQSTKQMLDELDALMEKMLSLPVNDPQEAPAFPKEVVKPPTLTPTLSATLTLLEAPTTAPAPALSQPEPNEHPSVNPPHLALQPAEPELPQFHGSVPQPEPLTNEVTPPSVISKLEPLLAEIPEASPPLTTQWCYLPLLWINQGFDSVTMRLGAGAWMRTQVGRMLLGLSGITMLVVAAAWFLKDWLGWN